jgi:hypothetical protein
VALTVVYDACVLHPAPLRDLLIRIAATGIVRARWSERILDECFDSILRQRKDLDPSALGRTRDLMNAAVPDCLVTGYEDLIGALDLPDPDDCHVLAAAIRGGAQAIVTANLVDFPPVALAHYGIEPKHPDEFVLETIELAPKLVVQIVVEQAAALKSPPRGFDELLEILDAVGLPQSAARLRALRGSVSGAGEGQ